MTEATSPSSPDSRDQRVPAYSWYGLSVLCLVYMVNFVDRQVLSILANDIKADLGLDDAQLGFLYGTAFAIFYALFGIPLGRLADGWSRKRLLGLGLALWSCMTVLSGFARNITTLTFARIGVGVGEATASPCAYSLIADWFPKRIRGTALAIYSAGLFVGSGLSLLVGGAIVEYWNSHFPQGGPLGLVGWQAAFLGVGLPGVLLVFLVLALREPERGAMDGIKNDPDPEALRKFWGQLIQLIPPLTLIAAARRGVRALIVNVIAAAVFGACAQALSVFFGNPQQFWFVAIGAYAVFSWASCLRFDDRATFSLTWKSRAFMAIVLAYSAVSFVGYSLTYWASPYAERTFELSKAELGWWIGAPAAVGGLLGVLFGGMLADRLFRKWAEGRMAVIAIGLFVPVPLTLLAYSTSSVSIFLLCSFLLQMATASALASSAAASQALVLPRMRGVATAIFFLGPTLIGLAFGPFITGYVSEATGSLGLGVKSSLFAVIPGSIALFLGLRAYSGGISNVEERACL